MVQKDDTRCNRPWRQPGGIYDPNTVAEYLRVSPEQIREFEESYRKNAIDWKKDEKNLFEYNSREAKTVNTSTEPTVSEEEHERLGEVKKRIAARLVRSTPCCIHVKDDSINKGALLPEAGDPVTRAELMELDTSVRPMCTDELVMKDVHDSSGLGLLQTWIAYKQEQDPKKKEMLYHHFRQGMDILDLDEVLYSMLDQNPNAMSHWLPEIAWANAAGGGFFRIPETTIVKVPLPILQLTRLDYERINQTTKDIVNEWARQVFRLREDGKYFIKT